MSHSEDDSLPRPGAALSATALVDQLRDPAAFLLDEAGCIASWNASAVRLKGWRPDEVIGRPYADLYPPEDQGRGLPAQEMAAAAAEGSHRAEGRRLRKDGSLVEVESVLNALRDERGQLLGFLKISNDIGPRKRLEREREAMLHDAELAREEAERASRAKDDFLATISHELRTPLSAILGWAHVLERGVLDPETVRHGLAAILRNARIQVQLIEDLLDLNRIENGKLRLEMQRTDLGGVVAAAIDSALPAATARRVGLRFELGTGGAMVRGDPARLQQVVGNLLSNAIKFSPEGGQVCVRLASDEAGVRVAVSDDGQGIEPGFLPRLFERFEQQDPSATRRHGGLGIGLAIVRHLVQLHGGQVQAASDGPGRGACFTVTLPAADGWAERRASGGAGPLPSGGDAPPEEAPRLDGVAVLLVDDEPEVRAVLARLLQDAGARVHTAADADEALERLRCERPAVLLSDIAMPGADGYELLRRVRALAPHEGGATPAAALTAFARPEDRQAALAAGYAMHLAKPVPPQTLRRAVAALAGAVLVP